VSRPAWLHYKVATRSSFSGGFARKPLHHRKVFPRNSAALRETPQSGPGLDTRVGRRENLGPIQASGVPIRTVLRKSLLPCVIAPPGRAGEVLPAPRVRPTGLRVGRRAPIGCYGEPNGWPGLPLEVSPRRTPRNLPSILRLGVAPGSKRFTCPLKTARGLARETSHRHPAPACRPGPSGPAYAAVSSSDPGQWIVRAKI